MWMCVCGVYLICKCVCLCLYIDIRKIIHVYTYIYTYKNTCNYTYHDRFDCRLGFFPWYFRMADKPLGSTQIFFSLETFYNIDRRFPMLCARSSDLPTASFLAAMASANSHKGLQFCVIFEHFETTTHWERLKVWLRHLQSFGCLLHWCVLNKSSVVQGVFRDGLGLQRPGAHSTGNWRLQCQSNVNATCPKRSRSFFCSWTQIHRSACFPNALSLQPDLPLKAPA